MVSWRRRILGALLASLMLVVGSLAARPAAADTPVIPVTVSATVDPPVTIAGSTISNASNGSVAHVNVDAQSPPNASASAIFGVDARLCKPGINFLYDAQFDPTAFGYCLDAPFNAGSDDFISVATAPPNAVANLNFRIGQGSKTVNYEGGSTTIECGPNHPCQLVLRLSVPVTISPANNGVNFKSFPINYAGSATVPGAPTAVTATAGNASADVAWTAPASDGGATITEYKVTSDPDGKTCTWTTGPLSCTVSGLTNGTPYTFTVKAKNVTGYGADSAASNSVTPFQPGSAFHPVTPFRALDSRPGPNQTGFVGPIGANSSKDLTLAPLGAIPSTAKGVIMNVTATGGTKASFLTVYPAGGDRPPTANLLFAPGQTVPNLVTVGIGTGGKVSFYNQLGNVQVIADVVGYFDDGSGSGGLFNALAPPKRLVDSRDGDGLWGDSPLAAGESRDLTVHGNATVPNTATAVVMNVTATGGTKASYLQVFPAGATKPTTANLLFAPGQTVPNLVAVGLGTGGAVTFFNQLGSVDVIADVVGYYDDSAGSRFHPITPLRLVDSRSTTGPTSQWGGTPITAASTRTLNTATLPGPTAALPADATGLVANVTATGGTKASYLSASPTPGPGTPATANLLFGVGQTIPNAVMVGIGSGDGVDFFNQQGSVHVIVDAAGYYAAT